MDNDPSDPVPAGILELGGDLVAKVAGLTGPVLSPLIQRMGQSSVFNLACGLAAIGTHGVAGRLTLQIPARLGDRIEVDWQPARHIEQPPVNGRGRPE